MKLVYDMFFLGFFDVKLWKKGVTNISNVLDIILKKNAKHRHLSFVARVQIIIVFILFFYFEVVVHETGA